ncbi:MAG TPA: ABC transporter permease [Acidimicrobiales bacterium]|nr:ABC transporter permease [Acidimicrobiales bacterium]
MTSTLRTEIRGLVLARGPVMPPSGRALRYWLYQYKRTYKGSITTSFLYPVLYLAAMGLGLGSLVDHHVGSVDHVRYLVFLAPGLLAATAMQIGGTEATYPVMGAIKWQRTYYAQLATPLRLVDVVIGHLGWIALRLITVTVIYLAVMAAFGTVLSPWALLAAPAGVLTGMAFATPIAAFAATQQREAAFTTIYRMALVPLFLFSGTFFPVSQLPRWLHLVAFATPLYHGVALCRDLALGQLHPGADLVHGLYLLVLVAVGVWAAVRTFRRRLVV